MDKIQKNSYFFFVKPSLTVTIMVMMMEITAMICQVQVLSGDRV